VTNGIFAATNRIFAATNRIFAATNRIFFLLVTMRRRDQWNKKIPMDDASHSKLYPKKSIPADVSSHGTKKIFCTMR
jgi:hypothetical protein